MNYKLVVESKCDICESEEFQTLSNKVQFNMTYRVVICKDCGLVQINPKPELNELSNFYVNEYDKYYSAPRNIGTNIFKERGYKIAEFSKEFLRNDINILEIGSGGAVI